MVKKTSGKKRSSGVTVDMSGVESGGGRPCRDGRWKAYPTAVELTESESSGNEYFKFRWKITSGPDKGATVWDNVSLTPQALWRLKTLMETMDMDVPNGVVEVDPDDFVGEDNEIVIEITNEKYQGKDQPRITGFGGEETEEDDDDDDKPKKPKAGKKSSKDDDDDDDDDADDDDDDDDDKSSKKVGKEDKRVGKTPKIKEGSKVQFEDDDGKTVKGIVTEIEDDTVKIEDKKGDEWEVPLESVELQ